jgi:hypothetical protein
MKKIIATTFILLLSACNDYEVQEVGKNTLLLNKSKGDVSIIDKGMIVQLPKYSLSSEHLLFSDGEFKEQLEVTIKSKVTFDRVFYHMVFEGKKTSDQTGTVSQKSFDWGNFIALKYEDKDGYLLFEKKLELNDFSYNAYNGLVCEGDFSVKPHISNKAKKLTFVYGDALSSYRARFSSLSDERLIDIFGEFITAEVEKNKTALVSGSVGGEIQKTVNAMPFEVLVKAPAFVTLFQQKRSQGLGLEEAGNEARLQLGREADCIISR